MSTLNVILELIGNNCPSYASFERDLGLKEKTVDSWKRGNSKSFFKILPNLAEYFNVTTDFLLEKSDYPNPAKKNEFISEKQAQKDLENELRYIQKIEVALKNKGLTAKKMLLDLGYADSLLNQWKKGTEPSAIKLQRIASYLDLSMDYLFKNEDENVNKGDKNSIKHIENQPEEAKKLIENISNLPIDLQEKAYDYINMLKTLGEVQAGENIIDMSKKA